MKKRTAIFIISLFLIISNQAYAAQVAVVGKITRTFSEDNASFGGCLIKLDVPIAISGCSTTWAALDCAGTFLPVGTGSRHYASALLAASIGKQVLLTVEDTWKHTANGSPHQYCVVKRFDILFQ